MKRFCASLPWIHWISSRFVPSKQPLVSEAKMKSQVLWTRNGLLLFMICSVFFLFALNVSGQQHEKSSACNTNSKSNDNAPKAIVQEAKKLYLKLETTAKGLPLSLKTSIVTLSSTWKNRSVQVHLVGAIHFAEPEYYRELDRRLAEYEMVLFELVTDKNNDAQALLAKKEKHTVADSSDDMKNDASSGKAVKSDEGDTKSESRVSDRLKQTPLLVLGAAQKLMCDSLGLTSQLTAINYGRKNMVHCDMDSQTLLKEILKGDDINTLIDELLLSFFEKEQGKDLGVLAAILFSNNRPLTLRRLAAREIADQMSPEQATLGQKSLIEARNSVVLDRIRRELDGGKTQIAVFYGAAHLPDFIVRLQTEYGFTFESCQWLEAWDMKP